MKFGIKCISALILVLSLLSACGSVEEDVSSSKSSSTEPSTISQENESYWGEGAKIGCVKTNRGYLLIWPEGNGSASFLVKVGEGEESPIVGNTYQLPDDCNVETVSVKAVDDSGNALGCLTWDNNELSSIQEDDWVYIYASQADETIHFESDDKIPVNKKINLDMTPFDQVKISYDVKLLSYTSGPSHYSGLPDDCTSAGVKICMGDTRVLISIEKNTLVGGTATSTWGNSVPFVAANDWHTYDVIMNNVNNTYEVYVDGKLMMSGIQSARSNIANNVEFYATGTSSKPADALYKNIRISCSADNEIPIWDCDSQILSASHQDGFTIVWPSAANADKYLVQIAGKDPIEVEGNCYTATGLQHLTNGYDVSVTAIKNGVESSVMLNSKCNAKFDPALGMDIKEILTGTAGGSNYAKYALYRIPGMIVTNQNTLIMYYEARYVSSDNGTMDILAFRSTDGGETFSDPILLADGAASGMTMNNPTMIVDGDTIHLLYCVNYGVCNVCVNSARNVCESHGGGGVYYRKSTDDGLTWSEPVNISDSTNPEDRYLIATGPGTGICKEDGTLIVPVWLIQKSKGDPANPLKQSPGDIAPLYSTDGGATWQMGDVLKTDFSTTSRLEPLPVVLSDGRIMYNIRCYGGWRGVAISDDGINDFSTVKFDKELIDPFCHAGLTAYNYGNDPYTLLFTNCENNLTLDLAARTNLVLKGSTNDGEKWDLRLVIDEGKAGYSAVITDQNGIIYVLYEVEAGKHVKLARLTYDYLVKHSK